MANLAGVLKELKQERTPLDHAIEVIGNLVGRNGTEAITGEARPKRTLSLAARRNMQIPIANAGVYEQLHSICHQSHLEQILSLKLRSLSAHVNILWFAPPRIER
jgi:hypothetical protein